MSLTQAQYLLEQWKFNADQRLKTFNFFVAFSIFANSGVFAAFQNCAHAVVLVLLGGFVIILSLVFALVDTRCRTLLRVTKHGLIEFERTLSQAGRVFESDRGAAYWLVRFTVAFNILFVLQGFFGLMVVSHGVASWVAPQALPWAALQTHCSSTHRGSK